MLNTPWDTGSPLYRRLVIAALILTGVGILLAIAGAMLETDPLVFAALPIIIAGMAAHLAGLVVRGRDAQRRHRPKDGSGPTGR
ncbi:hypothetical protein ASH00_01175 [Arthrobacter sp. Soil782]|uniref:hypothetical protein n=1 Tax=Arthrobacter sp. Soil782 TaxID=1736410 RepID=UPI0006F7AA7D|nr:hypothetical protein [Arthrobacter sp. Soil782]KRF08369.1 hypothetical protein ASH00_01175 [Arthrobacter sp. Soil782]